MKDPQALPGLSLAQWMNMQQSPSLANSMQPNYMNPLPGSVLQNLTGADISRQLTQIPQQNSLQFNAQRQTQPVQQLDQLQKMQPSSLNPLGSMMQPQQQLSDMNESRQNLIGQSSQAQSQMLPSQNSMQAQQQSLLNHQLQMNHLSQNLPQQQQQPQQQLNMMNHSQQQNLMQPQSSDHVPDNQIQMQLLQKLHQSQLNQLQDHQKQLLDIPQKFSKPISTSQMMDASQSTSSMIPQSHALSQQMTRNNSQTNLRFPQPSQQQKLQQLSELPGQVGHTFQPSNGSSNLFTGAANGGQSAVTDDVPSCSTSPSTNNCSNGVQLMMMNSKKP